MRGTTTAAISSLLPVNITANQTEAGDTTAAALLVTESTPVSITANQIEAGDTTSAAFGLLAKGKTTKITAGRRLFTGAGCMPYYTQKQACAREPFTLDWATFFEVHGLDVLTDSITSSVWNVTGGDLLNSSIDGVFTTVLLEGGVLGTPILAENTVEINGGSQYRDCRTLRIEVTE